MPFFPRRTLGIMSEYQYYEFQAVDRSLTREQMSELRNYSSRAEITADRFVNVYNYGSFKGDAKQWMERYFDAHLYFANWGTRILMLRIPGRLLDEDVLDPYGTGDSLCFIRAADAVILSFAFDEEEYSSDEWEGSLSSILPVRSSLMRGDLRALYLGWLMAVQKGEVDDATPEPPCLRALHNWMPPCSALPISCGSIMILSQRRPRAGPINR